MQREDKSSDQTKPARKSALVQAILSESKDAINKYKLEDLLAKAKKEGFEKLGEFEIELLTTGLIKLGEALTFCRDRTNQELVLTNIVGYSFEFAKARNHLVHHQLYHTYFYEALVSIQRTPEPYKVIQDIINKLPTINLLQKALIALESLKGTLNKSIGKGSNNFPFFYSHYITSLEQEFLKLNNILNGVESKEEVINKLSRNVAFEAALENRIRNILAIMVDLSDTGSVNHNKGDCKKEKEAVRQANLEFIEENPKFAIFFDVNKIKNFRNALCHLLDNALSRPYYNETQMADFLFDLRELGNSKYLVKLKTLTEAKDGSYSSSNSSAFFPKKKKQKLKDIISLQIEEEEEQSNQEEKVEKPLVVVPLVNYDSS